jgi:hypothetical protein
MAAAAQRQYPSEFPAALAAEIRIVHGEQLLADNREGDEAMCSQFEAWIAANYSISPGALAQPS